jgi:hypothetical protein
MHVHIGQSRHKKLTPAIDLRRPLWNACGLGWSNGLNPAMFHNYVLMVRDALVIHGDDGNIDKDDRFFLAV